MSLLFILIAERHFEEIEAQALIYCTRLSKMFSFFWTYNNESALQVRSRDNSSSYFINSFLLTNYCDEGRNNNSKSRFQRSGDYIVNVTLEGNCN